MLTVIVPCFNEAKGLPELARRVARAAATWGVPWEVILVDDGSGDETWTSILVLHAQDERFQGLRLARNFGQQAAIGAGLEAATGDAVAILDADLQDPPELLARALTLWKQGAEVVYGIRTCRPEAWWKRWCYSGYYLLLERLATVPPPRDAGDFCLMDRKVVAALNACLEQRPFWRGLRAWTGFRQVGVKYRRAERHAGQSQYSLRRLVGLAWDGIVATAPNPFRLVAWLALAWLLAFVVAALFGGSLDHKTILVCLGSLGGLQLFILSLLGGYAVRCFEELRGRPRWIVADRIGLEEVPSTRHTSATMPEYAGNWR